MSIFALSIMIICIIIDCRRILSLNSGVWHIVKARS